MKWAVRLIAAAVLLIGAVLWTALFVGPLFVGLWVVARAVDSLPPSSAKVVIAAAAYCLVSLAWFQVFKRRDAVSRRLGDALSRVGRTVNDVFGDRTLSEMVPSVVSDWFDHHPLTFGVESHTEVRATTIDECSMAGCSAGDEEGHRKVTEFDRVVAGRVVETNREVVWERCADHGTLATASHPREPEETGVERATTRAETT